MPIEAQYFTDRPATLRHARINAEDGERFGVVSADGHRYWLKPAAGCLLQPALGDRVLVSLEGQDGYILSVLERGSATPSHLSIEGDLRLHLPTGALCIETRDGILLEAGPTLAIHTEQTVVSSRQADLAIGSLKVTGERADSQWTERHDVAVHAHERAVLHSCEYGDSRRHVERHEDLRAGSLRQHVDNDWSLRGETLDLFADISVTLDSQRIKLG